MSQTITLTVDFAQLTASELFHTYLSPQRHAEALGAPVTISDIVGDEFTVFGPDGVHGRNLEIVPDKMIVQSWRGQVWQPQDSDSVLVLVFADTPHGAAIDLTHANVPDHALDMVNAGAWRTTYWDRWQQHFAAHAGVRVG